nr:MAG TPA: hypothetical protein [Caudoviricetes sp.]
MNFTDRFDIDLQLFAEGAGEGGTAEGTNAGVTEAVAALREKGRKNNPLADVKYGIQDEESPVAEAEQETIEPDREKAFEDLIKGEYKDLYDRRVRETLQKRLKGTQETAERLQALAPTMELLEKKYGVKAGDLEALNQAIEEDTGYFEDESAKTGIPVEQLKQMRHMERENQQLRQTMEELLAQESADRMYRQWLEQEQDTRQVYPQFRLEEELGNEQFLRLMRSGVDVKTAYEVVHKDEIIPAAMQLAAKTAEQKVVNKIRAGGARPMENGVQDQSASLVKPDVSQLSKADRAEIIRRAERGEKIRF